MKRALIVLAMLLASHSHARELWQDKGFSLTTVGWFGENITTDWIGVKVKMVIPPDGYVVLETKGSLEFHIPCKGWVEDEGIIVVRGCYPTPETGRDTLQFKQMSVTEDYGCSEQRGAVLMVVRLPRFFPKDSCKPDAVRWVGGYYDVER